MNVRINKLENKVEDLEIEHYNTSFDEIYQRIGNLEKQLNTAISSIAKMAGSYEARIRNLTEQVDLNAQTLEELR